MKRIWSISLTVALLTTMLMSGCSLNHLNLQATTPAVASQNSFDSELSLARLNERHGKHEPAAKIYQNIIAKDPTNVMANQRLGVIAAKQGQLEKALSHFDVAAKSGQPDSELLANIGYLHYLQKDFRKSEQRLRAAISLDPSNEYAHNNLGLILGEQGEFEESLAEFRYSGNEAQARNNLAFVQSQVGRLQEAETNYHHALSLDKSMRPAAEALIQVATTTAAMQHEQLVDERFKAEATVALPAKKIAQAMPDTPMPEILETGTANDVTLQKIVHRTSLAEHDMEFEKVEMIPPIVVKDFFPIAEVARIETPRSQPSHSVYLTDRPAKQAPGLANAFEVGDASTSVDPQAIVEKDIIPIAEVAKIETPRSQPSRSIYLTDGRTQQAPGLANFFEAGDTSTAIEVQAIPAIVGPPKPEAGEKAITIASFESDGLSGDVQTVKDIAPLEATPPKQQQQRQPDTTAEITAETAASQTQQKVIPRQADSQDLLDRMMR